MGKKRHRTSLALTTSLLYFWELLALFLKWISFEGKREMGEVCLREVGTFSDRIYNFILSSIYNFGQWVITSQHPLKNFPPNSYLSPLLIQCIIVEHLSVHSTGLAIGGSKAIEKVVFSLSICAQLQPGTKDVEQNILSNNEAIIEQIVILNEGHISAF